MAFDRRRKRKLLADLDKLTHSGRTRYMSEFGRDHAGTSELRDLLDSLDGDLYEWQLRLYAARAAREQSDIIEALSSPLRSVRAWAIASLRIVDIDLTLLTNTITDLTTADRRALLTTIRRQGNSALADQLIANIHEQFGASEASILLAACSNELAAEWLPRLDYAMESWSSFVRAHPNLFIDFLREQMSIAPIVRDAWWVKASFAISSLIDVNPTAVLDLWADFGPDRTLPWSIQNNLARLATADVDRTLTLLLAPAHRDRIDRNLRPLRSNLRHASDSVLATLAQALVHKAALATVLRAIAPSRRAGVFEQATVGIDTSQISWPSEVLKALPHGVRHAEARRMLELPQYQGSIDGPRHELLVWLPIEETWDELQAATNVSDASDRGDAYAWLVDAVLASRDPDYFERLLAELQRLRNEQDPVRNVALDALSYVPVHLVNLGHMTAIDNLVDFVVEARDTSNGTTATVARLLQRLLANSATPESAPMLARCIDALARLARQSGDLQLGRLHRNLPKGGEFLLFDALEPRLQADLRAGRPQLLFNLVRALGSRGHGIAKLEAMLGELTRSKNALAARTAIGLWLQIPGGKAAKLGELIEREPSVVLIHPVLNMISLMRQDLLDIALSKKALSGRFAPSKTAQIPMLHTGFHRWTPAQRRTYATLLDGAIKNEHTGHIRRGAIRSLARVPEVGTKLLRPLLHSDDVVTVEAALSGLTWGEAPSDELASLLSYADTDRARVAVFSASRAARFARPHDLDQAIAGLLNADRSKLTSRKEALRILARNRTPGALETFTALWEQRPLHRSLAIALAAALRDYPDHDLTWQVNTELAAGKDTALAVARFMNPLSWPSDCRPKLGHIAASLVQHEDSTVRLTAWRQLGTLRPWNDDVTSFISDAITDLSTVDRWWPPMSQLHLLLDGYPSDPFLAETTKMLAEQQVPANIVDANDRDLPVEQRLDKLATARPTSAQGKATMRLAAEHLIEAGFAAHAASFLTNGIDWSDAEVTLQRLADLGEQHPSALPRLYDVTNDALLAAVKSGSWSFDDSLPLCRQLVASTEAAGLVAIAMVTAAGPQSGWSQPWRELLAQLRQHDSVWVQNHARNTYTADE